MKKITVYMPQNGICGNESVVIAFPNKCPYCEKEHEFAEPNPQLGEWYSIVLNPCIATSSYFSLWKLVK